MSGWAAVAQAGMELFNTGFNARQARHNRNFQERMSSTAHQRAADDLEAAGLNRVLALGDSSSTPSGGQAHAEGSSAVSTGIAAASAKQQIAQSKAEEALIKQKEAESKSSENLNDALAVQSFYQQGLTEAQRWQTKAQEKYTLEDARRMKAEADRAEVIRTGYSLVNPFLDRLREGTTNFSAKNIWNGFKKPDVKWNPKTKKLEPR